VSSDFVEIVWDDQPVRIETRWTGSAACPAPLLVFLHEGLGSVSMWRDFPDQLCQAVNARGVVFSRRGYGRSTPPVRDERWEAGYMHDEAHRALPAIFDALGLDTRTAPITLIGHSDGGSMAQLFASRFPERVSRVVTIAPHIIVEDLSIQGIEQAREAFSNGPLRQGLTRHHENPDATFLRWNTIWLSPEFRHWSIEREVQAVRCPVLAVQGLDDPYGTLEQIYGIARLAPQTRIVTLPACGHSPHREQPQALLAALSHFLTQAPG
jgi:pimeloyl-ACP methyl ester carboxylesterase